VRSRLAQILYNFAKRLESKPKPLAKLSRELIAENYLRGEGIEIGAPHNPLKVPAAANTDLNSTEAFAKTLDNVLSPEPWRIDRISYDGEVFEIEGWALAPQGRHELLTFTHNDHEFEERNFPLERADIGNIFWYKAGSDRTAFSCRSSVTREELFKEGYVTLKCVNRETALPLREEFNLYYADDGAPELPDAARRRRVAGNDSADLFRLEGFGIFKKLDLALRRATSKSLGDFTDILDWGCGCGRVTRNFHLLPGVRLVGTDIDHDNINWCREHFNFGKFLESPLHPPMDLPKESFDLIIGISVFSHLREPDQQDWLAELARVAKPGAVLLMSTLGESSVCCGKWTTKMWTEWQQSGVFITEDNSGLGAYIGDDEFYVTTYITEDFIRRNWSRTFEILDFIPGYIGNYQDLVVMRKP
jgi:SAM-dependent methyltransferase